MDVSKWSMNEIMQLPDHAFGTFYVVSCTCIGGDGAANWDISELALPERFMAREVIIYMQGTGTDVTGLRVALGDQLPTTTGEMDQLTPVLPGFGLDGPDPRNIIMSWINKVEFRGLRLPFQAAGRRLILEAVGAEGKQPPVVASITVATLPREVPDWLISGRR